MTLKRPYIDKLNSGLKFFYPAVLLATWFGSGLIRPASGTWGSLASLFVLVPLVIVCTPLLFAVLIVSKFFLGWWASNRYEALSGEHDSGRIVIDEVWGMMFALFPLTLVDAPLSVSVMFAFALFRFFDALKPWPISWLDKNISGGLGVMLDDGLAGVISGVILYGILMWIWPLL